MRRQAPAAAVLASTAKPAIDDRQPVACTVVDGGEIAERIRTEGDRARGRAIAAGAALGGCAAFHAAPGLAADAGPGQAAALDLAVTSVCTHRRAPGAIDEWGVALRSVGLQARPHRQR